MNDRPEISPEILAAARLADSYTQFEIPESGINLNVVFDILRKNQVPLSRLLSEVQIDNRYNANHEMLGALIGDDNANLQLQQSEYAIVFDGLNKLGIPCVLIKSVGMAPSFPYTSDNVDLMVPRQLMDSARSVLVELGYTEFPHIEEPLKCLFRKYIGGNSVSAVHLHGQVGWGVSFLLDDELWKKIESSSDNPTVTIPGAEDALMITMAHALYENKRIKILDLVRIRYCLCRKSALNFEYILETVTRRGWLDGFSFLVLLISQIEEWLYGSSLFPEAIHSQAQQILKKNVFLSRWLQKELKREHLSFPFKVSFLFGKVIYYKKILSDREQTLQTRLSNFIKTLAWGVKLKLNIRGQRGFIISISGIDGSGKTIHANTLLDAFTTADILSSRNWSRFGSPNRILSGNARKSENTAASLRRRRNKLKYYWLRLVWLLVYLSKTCFEFGILLRLRRFLGGVIVCDRYIFDALVEIKHSIPDKSLIGLAQKSFLFFCPQPDLAWLLDVPAEMAAQRQVDEVGTDDSVSLLNSQRVDYLQLASEYGIRVLPTSLLLEQSTTALVRETLGKYFANYHTLINGFLLSNPSQMNPK